MSETTDSRHRRVVREGDKFRQMLPFGTDTLEVERVLEDGKVYVQRANGARQVFPESTLLETRYWVRVDD